VGRFYTSQEKQAWKAQKTTPSATGISLQMRGFAEPIAPQVQPLENRTRELGHRPEDISFAPLPQVDVMARKWDERKAARAEAKLQANIQAKLAVGAVGDKYEQEADQVASQVVQKINAPESVQRKEEGKIQAKPLSESIQRDEAMEEEDEELQMKPLSSSIQREEAIEEEDEELQMKPMLHRQEAIAGGDALEKLESSIQQAKGGGQSLDPNLQEKMGQAMGGDFSGVKVHTDSQSNQLNRSIQAKAFTTGHDVFFRQGAYNPSSKDGQELIAHELTHVLQQNGSTNTLNRVLQTKDDIVVQPWKDQNNKWHDGGKPLDSENWESFKNKEGFTLWRPKQGSGLENVTKPETEKVEKDYNAIFLMDPAKIRYSQDSIARDFKDGGSIQTLSASLKSGRVKASEIEPILLVEKKKNSKPVFITLDNRRLWAFKNAGVQVRCQWATPEEVKSNAFKFTAGKLGLATITVRI
jgi:hypothetical protein